MGLPNVFILWAHPLFDEAVRRLLLDWGVNVVGSTSDPFTALDQIRALSPNVVILEDADDPSEAEEQQTMAIINASPHVIRLNLNDNELRSYRRERRTVGKIEDLADLLMSDLETPDGSQ
jgi:DNA-binding NarL/FixJ family response regulator